MHYLVIIRLWTLLLVCAYAHQVERRTEAWDAAHLFPDIQYSGRYGIRNCGSNTTKVDAALKALHSALQPAIQDSTQRPLSGAYKTFFKDAVHSPYINAILSNISTGVQMPLNEAGKAHSDVGDNGNIQHSPEIICISKPGQLLYHVPYHEGVVDHYYACKERPDGAVSAYMATTQYIVLCPSFFALNTVPSEPTCPRFNRWTNRYGDRDGGKRIIHFQIFGLLHGITRFYISATSLGPAVHSYGINECVRLEARYARDNARSYEFYVANINSKCSTFPRIRDANGRELLGGGPSSGNMTEEPPPSWISAVDIIDPP